MTFSGLSSANDNLVKQSGISGNTSKYKTGHTQGFVRILEIVYVLSEKKSYYFCEPLGFYKWVGSTNRYFYVNVI